MLTYLIDTTDVLLSASILVGILFAYLGAVYGKWGKRIAWMGLGAGLVASAIRTAVSNTQRLVGGWRIGTYDRIITMILFGVVLVLSIVFAVKPLRKKIGDKGLEIVGYVMSSLFALFLAGWIFNVAPDIMIMPFKIDAGDGGVLSSDFLLKFGGYLIGLLIGVLTTVATEKIGTALAKKNMLIVLVVGFWAIVTLNVFYGFFRLMSTLIVRRYIVNQPLFNVAAESENHKEWYTYLGYILVLALAIVLWVRSFTQKEQYTTSAEHRKQRVVWRNAKRYSILAVVCFVLAILCTTYFVELNTIVITEAPLEEVQTTRMVFADNRFMRFEIETEKDLEDATYVTVNDIRRQEFSVESSGENKYTVSMLVGESSALRYTFKWYGSSGSSEIASAEYIPGTPTWENSDGTVKLTYLETYTAEEECIIIPFETVVDGHLHRFGYKTALNITSRFIVVLKTEGTSNYGVGLDACEVCGEAGYYENNDGQVVCKKCAVVMNKTTIGMKGGCNPIIIDYDIDSEKITVPVSEMYAHEKEFKK